MRQDTKPHSNHRKSHCKYFVIIITLFSIIIVIEVIILLIVNHKAKAIRLVIKQKEIENKDIQFDISKLILREQITQILLNTTRHNYNELIELKKRNSLLLIKLSSNKTPIRSGSTIITSNEDYLKLHEWSNCSIGELCFKGSRDEFSHQVFHSNCDNKTPTLTLIQSANEAVLGGFTRATWNGYGIKYDKSAFLFSLKYSKVYPIKIDMPAINVAPELLPYFGIMDIVVINKEGSHLKVLKCYETFKSGYQNHDLNTMKTYFKIKEIEVFVMKCIY